MFSLLNFKNISVVGVLVFTIVLGFYILQNKNLRQDLDKLQEKYEQKERDLEMTIDSHNRLIKEYNMTLEVWANLDANKTDREKKIDNMKTKIYKRQSDAKIDEDIANSVDFISNRLWN